MGGVSNEESTTTEFKTSPRRLPPGVILGPDGKPCRVCTAFRQWNPVKNQSTTTTGSHSTSNNNNNVNYNNFKDVVSASLGAASGMPLTMMDLPRPANCPPDVEQLGRATWTFLHTTAAYYPERADPTQARHMRSLLSALPTLYPCSHCASHLGECMKRNPPDVTGRAALSRWLCERHNEVNESLGKPLFDCTKTDERWRDGPADGSCD